MQQGREGPWEEAEGDADSACWVAGHRLDLGGLGKKQRAILTPLMSGSHAFGLLRQGEDVLWGAQPVEELAGCDTGPQQVRVADTPALSCG